VAALKTENDTDNKENSVKNSETISGLKKEIPLKIAKTLPINETIQPMELAKMDVVEISDYNSNNDEPMVIDAFVQEIAVVNQPMGKAMKKENDANKDQIIIDNNLMIINLISTTY
jgi:nitrogenase subunit NifH